MLYDRIIGISDAELVKRIRKGENACEEEFCRRYLTQTTRSIAAMTRNPDDAEDLAQDTMMLVLSRIRDGAINQPEKLAAFVHSTAKFIFIGHYRKQTRRSAVLNSEFKIHVEMQQAVRNEFQDLEHAEIRDWLARGIDELGGGRDRVLLRSMYLHGQEKSTLCDTLELTPEHFDRVACRARQRLKARLMLSA